MHLCEFGGALSMSASFCAPLWQLWSVLVRCSACVGPASRAGGVGGRLLAAGGAGPPPASPPTPQIAVRARTHTHTHTDLQGRLKKVIFRVIYSLFSLFSVICSGSGCQPRSSAPSSSICSTSCQPVTPHRVCTYTHTQTRTSLRFVQ